MPEEIVYRHSEPGDYAQVYSLWKESGGIGVTSKEDSEESITRFIARNGQFCFTALAGDRLVGMVLCGSDGRSGRFYHIIVAPEYRRQGIGHKLVSLSLEQLRKEGICGADAVIFKENPANEFWEAEEFRDRTDLKYRDILLDKDNVWVNRDKRPGDWSDLE
ncbi:MAG: GNAT family N-acetyltransferase [Methanomethylophilus sp.]|jgi:ribosomal protein S18 acetylase RimI-like enzyme